MALADAVFGHGRFIWVLQTNVLVMLLHPGFSGMAGLPTVSFTTFTGCAIHYGGVKNMKIKI
jgi:hypothetical protein